jgi:hypothetical protein
MPAIATTLTRLGRLARACLRLYALRHPRFR